MKTIQWVISAGVAIAVMTSSLVAVAQGKIQPVPFVPDGQHPIKRIALLDTPEQKFVVMDTGGGSAVFGLVGLASKSGRLSATTAKLNEEFGRQQVALGKAIDGALEAALRAKGFDVTRLPGVQPTPGSKETGPGFENIKADADAILMVRIAMSGYISRVNVTTEYVPLTLAVARLRSADGTKDLMLSFMSYCSGFPKNENVLKLACQPEVQPFTSDEALTMQDGPAAKNLLSAAPVIAASIADQLQPPSSGSAKP